MSGLSASNPATIGPLLSSVSVMLAAFGFFYNSQKDKIDAAADGTTQPDDPYMRKALADSLAKPERSALLFAGSAFVVWLLLLPEIVDCFVDAVGSSVSDYATPRVIFFVAANAWLAVAIYVACRAAAIHKRKRLLEAT
jgi:hypothetical protein